MRNRTIALVALALSLIGAEQASACSCAGPTEGQSVEEFVRERAKASDGVIVGKLIRVAEHGGDASGFGPATFTYRIKRSYKRVNRLQAGTTIRIESNLSGASCGLPQREGSRTGLFLERFEGQWSSNLCSVIAPRALRDTFGDGRARASSASPACGPGSPA